MAKADYPCPDCGTSITIQGRNRRDADYQASKATRVCKACSDAAFAKTNAEAAASNDEAGLPPLQGTPKQIAWAETIRAGRIALLDASDAIAKVVYAAFTAEQAGGDESVIEAGAAAMQAQPHGAPLGFGPGAQVFAHLGSIEHWREFVCLLRNRTDAHAWIDHRYLDWEAIARIEKQRVQKAVDLARPGGAEQAALEADVMAEAVLKPSCELSGQRIAEITYAAPHLRIRYDVKNDVLRELVKGRGFHWEHTVWERTLDERHGDPVHRMAETAHMLLAAGFQCRVMHNDAREMAISGDFDPEQTRWLRFCRAGELAGWTVSTWLPIEDLYDEAKRVPGARYVSFQGVYFPPGSILEAFDFAERYDFAISGAARAALAAHEAALAAGIVVDAKPRSVKKVSKARPVLATSQEGIDADLLDRD